MHIRQYHMHTYQSAPHACISVSTTYMHISQHHIHAYQSAPHACISVSTTCMHHQAAPHTCTPGSTQLRGDGRDWGGMGRSAAPLYSWHTYLDHGTLTWIMAQRGQPPSTWQLRGPTVQLRHVSSSKAPNPLTTRLGRKHSMSTCRGGGAGKAGHTP